MRLAGVKTPSRTLLTEIPSASNVAFNCHVTTNRRKLNTPSELPLKKRVTSRCFIHFFVSLFFLGIVITIFRVMFSIIVVTFENLLEDVGFWK